MFLFGDIARTTQLFHSSDIAELMAEPPVAGRGRKQGRGTAAVAHLVHPSETGGQAAVPPAVRAAAPAPESLPRRERAAA